MLKKYIAIILMSIAHSILLGHSVIPHHHHDIDLVENQLADDHHHSQDNDQDWNDIFSHLLHGADGISFTSSSLSGNIITKQLLALVAVLPDELPIEKVVLSPPLFSLQQEFIYHSPQLISSQGLRAPPVCIG